MRTFLRLFLVVASLFVANESARAQVGVQTDGEINAPATPRVQTNVQVQAQARVEVDRAAAREVARDAIGDAFSRIRVPMRLSVDGSLGVGDLQEPVSHGMGALGLAFDIDPTSWLGFGARMQHIWMGRLIDDADGDGVADAPQPVVQANMFTAGPRFRLWTDDEMHSGWSLGLGAGYLQFQDQASSNGLVLETSIERIAGARAVGQSAGFAGGLFVRAQQGVGATSDYRALLFGVSGSYEWGLDSTRTTRWSDSPFRYTFGFDAGLGFGLTKPSIYGFPAASYSLGASFGIPIGSVIEPQLHIDVGSRVPSDRNSMYSYAASGGIRLRFDSWIPLYALGRVGYAGTMGTAEARALSGAFVDAGVGLRFSSCTSSNRFAYDVGVTTRIGVDDNAPLSALLFTFGVEYEGGTPFARPRCVEPVEVEVAVPSTPSGGVVVEASVPPTHVVVEAGAPPANGVIAGSAGATVQAPVTAPQRVVEVVPEEAEEPEVPSIPGEGFGVRFGVSPLLGLVARAPVSTGHLSAGVALNFDARFGRVFNWTSRFTYIGGGIDPLDADMDGFRDDATTRFSALTLGMGPKLNLWTDEGGQESFDIELTGGYARASSYGSASGGFIDLGIARQIGARFGSSSAAVEGALTLNFQQGLGGMSEYSALLMGLRVSFSGNNALVGAGSLPNFRHTFGVHTLAGGALSSSPFIRGSVLAGFGLSFGLPMGQVFEARTRVDYVARSTGGETLHEIIPFLGLRARLDDVYPIYVEASYGYAMHFGMPSNYSPSGSVIDFGAGYRLQLSCDGDSVLQLGVHGRVGLEGNRSDDAIYAMLEFEYAGGTNVYGDSYTCRSRRESRARIAREVAERREWNRTHPNDQVDITTGYRLPPARPATTTVSGGGSMQAGGSVHAGGGVQVDVEAPPPPPPPRPIEIDVPIGVSLFGGALSASVSPAMLPLAQLRGAGYVTVRVYGPANAIGQVSAQIRATVTSSGARVDGIATVATGDPTIHAVFTIYPPGTRP